MEKVCLMCSGFVSECGCIGGPCLNPTIAKWRKGLDKYTHQHDKCDEIRIKADYVCEVNDRLRRELAQERENNSKLCQRVAQLEKELYHQPVMTLEELQFKLLRERLDFAEQDIASMRRRAEMLLQRMNSTK